MYVLYVTAVFIEGIMPVNRCVCVCVCVCVCARTRAHLRTVIIVALFMIPVPNEGCSSASLRLLFNVG